MNTPDFSKIISNLHCFTCVGTYLSFTKAADELCLTQSAVSHRIRVLEGELGFPLFHRFTRRIKFTEEGERLYSILHRSLSEIEAEVRHIQSQELSGNLYVSCPPSFPGCWLLPKINSFHKRYPGINFHLRCRNDLVDFENDNIHVAIYYGKDKHPGLCSIPLMDEKIFPVCSKEYAAEHNLYDNPAGLIDCTLLHDAQAWPNAQYFSEWKSWLDFAGFSDFNFNKAYTFDRSELALFAAAEGIGVAMGRSCLTDLLLSTKRLIVPFDQPMLASQIYSVVMPQKYIKNVKVLAFCQWLNEQVNRV